MKKCQPRSLTPFLDGELTEDAWEEVDEHLQACPTCSAQLDELTAASQHVRSIGRAHIPEAALRTAADIIAARVGLTPEAMLAATTEVARAQPQPAPSATSAGDAWTRALAPAEPAPEIEIPDDANSDDTTPDEPLLVTDVAIEAVDTAAPEPVPELVETDPEPSPTWVQPETWGQPGGPESAAAAPQAPAAQAPEGPVAAAAPQGPAAQPPEVTALTPPPEPAAGAEPVDGMPLDGMPLDGMPLLEEHPPAPPSPIVPSWMDDVPVSEAELEIEGRQAVDDAIGPAGEEAQGPPAAPDDVTLPAMGPTSAAEAELRALADDREAAGEGGETPGSHAPWSRLSAMLGRGSRHEAGSDEAELSTPAAEAAPAETEAPPAETEAPPAETEAPPAETEAPPAEPEAPPAETEAPPAETAGRPEAEHLMWIAPRREAGIKDQADAAPAGALPTHIASEAALETGDDVGEDASNLRGYREALVGARAEPPKRGLRFQLPPELGIRVGLGAALLVILLAAAALFVGRSIHPSSTAATGPATHQATPGGQPTTSSLPSAAPSSAASPAGGQLTELVSAGAGGTGWTVSRIRVGSPGSGVTRVVLDISGSGPTPTAQMGRGSDGAVYLTVPGLSISPSMVAAATPFGVVTGISQTGPDGTSLRFATNGNPGFSVGYLPSPYRLVLDFK